MPPDAWASLPSWIETALDIGLTGWLVVCVWALVTGRVPTKGQIEQERKAQTERLAYVEARRLEERDGRIAAEKRVADLTERWDRSLTFLSGIEKELIRASRSSRRPK
jgi:hypothetical protein